MNSLITFGRQLLPFALLFTLALYIGLLITLIIFRFGFGGISVNNIKDVTFSRTMLIIYAILLILLLLLTVDRFLFLKKLKKEQQRQQQFYQQFNERINEQLKELKEKQKGQEK